ncbi:hypothetical protein [Salegentibacter sediminis]|uniref:hypothetical protein n=1 Tax=Salegentibacter sediminis TaxID=1930251 RepID=UPI0009BF4D16|nr:hypothetical protein [Salegentibacter sediminis]
MKKKITFIVFIFLFPLISCNKLSAPGKDKQFEGKSYVRLFFNSEEECMAAQPPDFFINCHQQIDFLKDNEVEIMLSDIIWRGTYKVINKKIIISMEPNFEVPSGEIIFLVKNNTLLIKSDDKTEWRKMKGNSIWN